MFFPSKMTTAPTQPEIELPESVAADSELKLDLEDHNSTDMYLRQCAKLLVQYKKLTTRYERIAFAMDVINIICQTTSTLGVASIFATSYPTVGGAIAICCNIGSTVLTVVKKIVNPDAQLTEYLGLRNTLTNLLDSMLDARNKNDAATLSALQTKLQGIIASLTV